MVQCVPWIFDDVARHLQGETVHERCREDKLQVILRHLELILKYKDERAALHCMTNRIALYGKTLGHVKPLKERVRLAKSELKLERRLEAWATFEQ